ncbi:hypothetical protein P9B04_18165, partial [Crocosphaera sp. Alani8]
MTRFIYDQFSKDLLETLLLPYGVVEGAKRVSSEVREIDVWFVPRETKLPSELGLLACIIHEEKTKQKNKQLA